MKYLTLKFGRKKTVGKNNLIPHLHFKVPTLTKIFQLVTLLLFPFTPVIAQTVDPTVIRYNQQKRAEEREREGEKLIPKTPDIKLSADKRKQISSIPENETNCFIISEIRLVGNEAPRFQFALEHTLSITKLKDSLHRKTSQTEEGSRCLGAEGIKSLIAITQNSIIEHGFVTTRVTAQPQNLRSGTLILTVTPGRIGKIKTEQSSKRRLLNSNTFTAMPFYGGNILNIRDLEQGLETLDRPSTVEANIKIEPGKNPNESDLG